MDHATARHIRQVRELCETIWTIRTELDRYREQLQLLRRSGHPASELELWQAADSLRELARATGALYREAQELHQEHAQLEDVARFRRRQAA
jgi:hypothetical protein